MMHVWSFLLLGVNSKLSSWFGLTHGGTEQFNFHVKRAEDPDDLSTFHSPASFYKDSLNFQYAIVNFNIALQLVHRDLEFASRCIF